MTPKRFCRQLLDGDAHCGGIRCLGLFRIADDTRNALRSEVAQLRRERKPSRVNSDHITGWVGSEGEVLQYSLLNATGKTEDFGSDHDLSARGKWFFDSVAYPVLGRWIDDWPDLINCRINVLGPGAALGAHEEHVPFRTRAGTVGARLRFHLPLETSPQAELNLDGLVYHLAAAQVTLVNQGCVHAARNLGDRARVHLVADALLTQDLFRFLFEPGRAPPDFSPLSQRELIWLRREPLPPHRRLPAHLGAGEVARLGFCEPQ